MFYLQNKLKGTPQALLQLFYVLKIKSFGSKVSGIVYLSLIWSLWTISSKSISEDKSYFKKKYRSITKSKWYIVIVLYRMMDVTYRISVLLLVWLILGGFGMFCIIIVEFICLLVLSKSKKEFGLMNCIVLTPLVNPYNDDRCVDWIRSYRRVSNSVFITVIYVFTFVNFNCPTVKLFNNINDILEMSFCIDYNTRHELVMGEQNRIILGILIYATILSHTRLFSYITEWIASNTIKKMQR